MPDDMRRREASEIESRFMGDSRCGCPGVVWGQRAAGFKPEYVVRIAYVWFLRR